MHVDYWIDTMWYAVQLVVIVDVETIWIPEV
jgi:hypothetical protein